LQQAMDENLDRYQLEKRYVHRSGEALWCRVTVSVIRDADGTPKLMLGVVEDITERRRVVEALRASQERYRALFDGGNDAVFVYEIGSDGLPTPFREVNSIACQRLGYSREELLGLTMSDLHSQEGPRRLGSIMDRLQRERRILLENVHVARDGTQIPVEISARLIEIDGRSTVISIVRDITERKRAEEALRRSEEQLRALLANMWDTIQVLDAEGTLLFVSPSVKRSLGYDPDELVGTTLLALVHPDDQPVAREVWRRARETSGAMAGMFELRVRHADGSWRDYEGVGTNLLEDPVVHGVVINARDVTERRTAEEALNESRQQLLQAQKMDAVGRLAGGIAHDFNNMLTAIQGFAELLALDLGEREPERGYVEEIRRAAERSGSLTRQLLAFSRRQVLQPRVLDLNGTVREMDRMLRRLIGADVELVTVLAPGLGPVLADPGQLEQVVLNLAVNAREAMPSGGRLTLATGELQVDEAEVRRLPFLRPGRYVQLRVSDTGTGMSRDVQAQVFEPFFTTKENGTGLGLATVYGIVAQSGGHVWVESEPGRGSTFRILLPRVNGGAEPGAREPAAAGSADGAETVLLVEDEPTVRLLARKVLQRSGYRVLEAENGAEAIRLFGEHGARVDLVLTDVVMPRMGGVELVGRLTAQVPSLRVVYMSGYTDEAILRNGVREQGRAFLQKPFSPETLIRKVREVLDGG
ncbi:MAG: PAS domain S-box protein, partial [Gemmatimonadetes bacterium]|nr:PAS domain S-box protein [Gemmatimonadota bacterium]